MLLNDGIPGLKTPWGGGLSVVLARLYNLFSHNVFLAVRGGCGPVPFATVTFKRFTRQQRGVEWVHGMLP